MCVHFQPLVPEMAKQLNTEVVALSIGNVDEAELKSLGAYGASKVVSINDDKLAKLGLQFTSRRAFGGYYINQPPEKAETRDWDMIRSWAEEIGQIMIAG